MLLSNGFNPDVRVYKEAKTLVENGHKVTILAWDRLRECPKKEVLDGINIERIHISSVYGNIFQNSLNMPLFWTYAFFKLLFRNFDVIHCHDFDTLLPGFLLGKLKGKKIVYDAHESYPVMKSVKLPAIIIKLIAFLEGFLSRRTDYVITVNDLIKKIFNRYGVSKVAVIMNCPRLEDYDIPAEKVAKFRKKINPDNNFLIIYIGGFQAERGLEEMLYACSKIKEDKIKIIFCGRGVLEKKLKNIVKENKLQKCVSFMGFIRPEEVPIYTKASDLLFIFYNKNDPHNTLSSPNKLFDAIAAKKPIIVTNVGILGDVVREEKIGFVIGGGNIDELADKIKTIMNNKEIYNNFAKNAEKASLKYNWRNMEKKLLYLYSNLK